MIRVLAVVVFLLGTLILVTGLVTFFVAVPNWKIAACHDTETAKSNVKTAEDMLATANANPTMKGSSAERYYSSELYQSRLELERAEKRCEDGKLQEKTFRLYSIVVSALGFLISAAAIVLYRISSRGKNDGLT